MLSLIALLGGIGLLFTAFGRWYLLGWHGREQAKLSFRAPGDVALTPSQRACAWFFFVMAALLDPDLRRLDASDDIMRAVAKRFGVGSLVALGILLVTGAATASHYSRWSDNALQAKLMLLVLIGVLTALLVITPYARARSIGVFLTSVAVLWLGVVLTH